MPGFTPHGEELVAESHVVGPCHPAQECGRECIERHKRRVHGPLLLHHAAIENDKTRDTLQPDQRGRCHLPRVVRLVQPLRRTTRRGVGHPRGRGGERFDVCMYVCMYAKSRMEIAINASDQIPPPVSV